MSMSPQGHVESTDAAFGLSKSPEMAAMGMSPDAGLPDFATRASEFETPEAPSLSKSPEMEFATASGATTTTNPFEQGHVTTTAEELEDEEDFPVHEMTAQQPIAEDVVDSTEHAEPQQMPPIHADLMYQLHETPAKAEGEMLGDDAAAAEQEIQPADSTTEAVERPHIGFMDLGEQPLPSGHEQK